MYVCICVSHRYDRIHTIDSFCYCMYVYIYIYMLLVYIYKHTYSARYFYFICFCPGSRCMAVDREFACMSFRCVYIVFSLDLFFSFVCLPFGLIQLSLVRLWASFCDPFFGAPWVHKRLCLGSLWVHPGFLGMPVASLGPPWVSKWSLGWLWAKMNISFWQGLERWWCLRIKSDWRNSPLAAPAAPYPPKVAQELQLPTPFTRAGDQDDGSQTDSFKLFYI